MSGIEGRIKLTVYDGAHSGVSMAWVMVTEEKGKRKGGKTGQGRGGAKLA